MHRDWIVRETHLRGIGVGRYFAPIHLQPIYKDWATSGTLQVTERIAPRTIALPFFNRIQNDQIEEVCSTLTELAISPIIWEREASIDTSCERNPPVDEIQRHQPPVHSEFRYRCGLVARRSQTDFDETPTSSEGAAGGICASSLEMTGDRNSRASSIGLFGRASSSRRLIDLALQVGENLPSNFLASFALRSINRSARSSGFLVIRRLTLRLRRLRIV